MDDCILEYKIYIQNKLQADSKQSKEEHKSLLAEYLAFLRRFIDGYIWQDQSFNLSYVPMKGDALAHLWGQTHYGDNVEDEWFIIFLLLQLTSNYPDITISVQDSDGDFLLIEAAHDIPKWLNPETSENRVFIQGGKLHIIPLPSSPREITMFPTGIPSLPKALELIHGPCNTEVGPGAQQAVMRKVEGYPDKAEQLCHHANCFVPAAVKFVLGKKPSLISAAVKAFYQRDPIDMKVAREARNFPPKERMMTRIRFTRCLYAQIMQQNFHPDKKSVWHLPASTNPLHKAHQLGMKITCGFEILSSRSKASTQSLNKPSGVEWQRYLQCLKQQGYFKEEIEGSNLYMKLLSQAEQHFVESFRPDNTIKDDPGSIVLSLLQNNELNLDKMREEEKTLPPEDDDNWLSVTAEELDNMLNKYQAAANTEHAPAHNGCKEEFSLEKVTESMRTFVDKVSSYEGAEFPGENENEEISFDADTFMDTMKQLLEGKTEGMLGSSSEEEDSNDSSSDDDGELLPKESEEFLSYMDEMDRELAATKIGQTFEKEEKAVKTSNTKKKQVNKKDTTNTAAKQEDFFSKTTSHGKMTSEQTMTTEENMTSVEDQIPVDVDLNLVKNLLESFSSQEGLAGPASNILNAMGVRLPLDEER